MSGRTQVMLGPDDTRLCDEVCVLMARLVGRSVPRTQAVAAALDEYRDILTARIGKEGTNDDS
jgi:hypothetical protein